jgi:hypothetical protein
MKRTKLERNATRKRKERKVYRFFGMKTGRKETAWKTYA